MLKLTTPAGVFGPYTKVDTLSDRYRCDGADLPFIVVGEGVIADAEPGDFPPPPAPPPPVPQSVTMRQARLALLGANLLTSVETAINAMSEPAKSAARIEWDYSNELQRSNPLVTQLGAALGLTTEQIDALFVTAATL